MSYHSDEVGGAGDDSSAPSASVTGCPAEVEGTVETEAEVLLMILT